MPVFKEQLRNGGPLKVTHTDMTRFIMSLDKAIELVLKAAHKSVGGEIFILKMSALQINDLAKAVIDKMAPKFGYKPDKIKTTFIGKRDGEKMYEELMNEDEAKLAYETDDMFILTTYDDNAKKENSPAKGKYISSYARLMNLEEIKKELETSNCLE